LNPIAVLVHTNPDLLGETRGGVQTALSALLTSFDDIMLPAFTRRTQIVPQTGPADNAMEYGGKAEVNSQTEMFSEGMLPDAELGELPELLRQQPYAARSSHPILSFIGIGVDAALQAQSLEEPLAPIRVLADLNGWVLLLGVDHRSNVTLHYAEYLAGRKQFTRWALTKDGVIECPNMPGCPKGLNAISSAAAGFCRQARLGEYRLLAFPVGALIQIACGMIRLDAQRLLCEDEDCPFCAAVKRSLKRSQLSRS